MSEDFSAAEPLLAEYADIEAEMAGPAAADVVRRGYLPRLPYRASKRATRPPVSRIFCLPV